MLFICCASCMLYSAGSGVKSACVLSGLKMICFCDPVCISCMCDLMFSFAMFMSFCVDDIMTSSAYVVRFTGACGVGMSDVYMLNNVCDRTPPCGTPVLNWHCVWDVSLV